MNNNTKLLSISEFSTLSGITRANLIYYDNEDILKPILRGENKYRMYDYKQLNMAYVIVSLRKMGLSLANIKKYLSNSSLETAGDLFLSQIDNINKQINQLEQLKYTMSLYVENISKYTDFDISSFTLEEQESQPLSISPHTSELPENITSMTEFLMLCRKNGIDCNCHIGRIFTTDSFLNKNWSKPDYIFFKKKKGSFNTEKGLYLVYSQYSDGTDLESIYQKIYDYINNHNLTVKGNIYEDYPLSSITGNSNEVHFIRISIPVDVSNK